MECKLKGNYGELEIRFDVLKGSGAYVAREFLKKLVQRITVRSTEYCQGARRFADELDYAFAYGEKPFHFIICPSLADLTVYFLAEHPSKRKPAGEKERSGLVDYWIFHKNYSFMIEFKHEYFGYKREKILQKK
ncbi:MAG: hypothetical protein QXI71_02720 [Candidatus Bathyarchaeia archaeon]